MFGHERILEVLNVKKEESVHELDKAVRAAVDEFVGEADQFDDMTTLCIRYNGPEKGKTKNDT